MKSAGDEIDIPIYRNRKWLAGFFLLGIVATIVEVSVLAVLPLSLVAPFAGLTIVFSLILASTGLLYTPGEQETLSRTDWSCIGLVLLGVTLVSSFGPHDSGAPPLAELVAAFARPRFPMFVSVGALAAAVVLIPWLSRLCSATLLPLVSAFAAAACGCISQLMLKLLATAFGALPAAGQLQLALSLGGLVCSAPLHLALLNRTLAGSAVAIAVPCYQFLLIVCTTAAGGILFDEFATLASKSIVCYAIGVVVATIGLVALSFNSSSNVSSDGDTESSDEGADAKSSELEPVNEGMSLDQRLSETGSPESSSEGGIEVGGSGAGLPPPFPHFLHRRPSLGLRPEQLMRGGSRRQSLPLSPRRESLILGSFGASSLAALNDLREASRSYSSAELDSRGRLRQRATTWSEGLHSPSLGVEAIVRAKSSKQRRSSWAAQPTALPPIVDRRESEE